MQRDEQYHSESQGDQGQDTNLDAADIDAQLREIALMDASWIDAKRFDHQITRDNRQAESQQKGSERVRKTHRAVDEQRLQHITESERCDHHRNDEQERVGVGKHSRNAESDEG